MVRPIVQRKPDAEPVPKNKKSHDFDAIEDIDQHPFQRAFNQEDAPARVDRVRGSMGNVAINSGTTFEKTKMLQITTNLNEIFITNC